VGILATLQPVGAGRGRSHANSGAGAVRDLVVAPAGDLVVVCAAHPDATNANVTKPRAACLDLDIAVAIARAAVVVAVSVAGAGALRDSTGR
jgi:hypothetical protein